MRADAEIRAYWQEFSAWVAKFGSSIGFRSERAFPSEPDKVLAGVTPQELFRSAIAQNLAGGAQPSDRFFVTPDDKLIWDVPKRLAVGSAYFTLEPFLSQSQRADWAHVDIRLMRWAALFIEYARKRGIPLYAHTALRGEAEQNRVNHLGHSKAEYPLSAHNIGEGVDIVHSVYHWELTPQEWRFLAILAQAALRRINTTLPKAEQLSLNWGGDDGTPSDKFRWDPAHWEISDFRNRRRRLPAASPIHRMPRSILKEVKL